MALIAYLWIAFALNYIDRQMVYSMFPALKADLGFSSTSLGLIGSVFMWVYTLSMPIAGRLADLWRRDALVVSSLLLWSAATLGCGLAESQSSFLLWRGIMGLTESLYYPTALALIASHYAEGQRSRALSIHQSAQLVGVIIGGWYGGWAADHVGWRQAFLVAAAIGIGYSAILAYGLRAHRSQQPTAQKQSGNASDLLRSRTYLALCFAFSCFCAIQWIYFAWFPTFLQERFALSMTDSGWNATVFVQGSTIIGLLSGGALADRLRRNHPQARLYVAASGILGSAPFAYLTFSAASLNQARLFSCGFGLFAGLLAANAFSAAYDVIGEKNRGLAAGVLNMSGGISSGAMIYLAGIWKDTIGFAEMLFWMMTVAMLSAIALAATTQRQNKRSR